MTITKIGRLRAHQAVDAIALEQDAWDMTSWIRPNSGSSLDLDGESLCGYTMCFAGWLDYLDPKTKIDFRSGRVTVENSDTTDLAARALELLSGQRNLDINFIEGELDRIYFNVFLATSVDTVDELRELVNEYIGPDPRKDG